MPAYSKQVRISDKAACFTVRQHPKRTGRADRLPLVLLAKPKLLYLLVNV